MKKILAVLLMTLTASAFAHGYGYRGPVYVNNYGYRGGWVAPALAGVAVGALAARSYYTPPPAVYVQPQVVYTQPPVYVQQPNPVPSATPGYHWSQVLDPACNCYKYALIPD